MVTSRQFDQSIPTGCITAIEGTFVLMRAGVATFANVFVVVFHFGTIVCLRFGDDSWWMVRIDGIRLIFAIIILNVCVSVHVLHFVLFQFQISSVSVDMLNNHEVAMSLEPIAGGNILRLLRQLILSTNQVCFTRVFAHWALSTMATEKVLLFVS